MNFKALSYVFGEFVHRPLGPTAVSFVVQLSTRTDANGTVL